MSIYKRLAVVLGAALAVGLPAGPAPALRMDLRNARQGCANLVTQAHPDVKGKKRTDEIAKCKSDPDAYSKAAGL